MIVYNFYSDLINVDQNWNVINSRKRVSALNTLRVTAHKKILHIVFYIMRRNRSVARNERALLTFLESR